MRFSLALLAVTAAVATALPHTASTDSSMLSVNEPRFEHKVVEARDLKDTLGGLKDVNPSKSKAEKSSSSASPSTSSTTSSTASPTSTTTSSSSSEPTSSKKGGKKNPPQKSMPNKFKGDDVTVVHDAGTTKNKKGFKWAPESSSE